MTTTQPQLLHQSLNPADVVYTPEWVVQDMLDFFKPTGRILEPSSGRGAFLRYLPGADWCEIEQGRDFFQCHDQYNWIIGNPPYSIYTKFLHHSFDVAENIVYLVPCNKPFNSLGLLKLVKTWGGIVHMRIYGAGKSKPIPFPIGFAMGAIHYQRGYTGPMYTSFHENL